MANDLVNMSCREYANTMHPGWGEFTQGRQSEVIYLHAGSRIRITHEQHSQPGFGFDRMEAIDESYAEHGKSSCERDAEEFVKDFIEEGGEVASKLLQRLRQRLRDREAGRANG